MAHWQILAMALVGLFGASVALRDRCAITTSSVLLGNWLACTGFAMMTGDQFHSGALFAIDYTSAAVLFGLHRERTQLIVVALFALEVVAHAAFSFTGDTVQAVVYYDLLIWTATAQACIMGFEVLRGGLRLHYRHRDARRSASSPFPLLDGMGSTKADR